jgi:hypothetical protein
MKNKTIGTVPFFLLLLVSEARLTCKSKKEFILDPVGIHPGSGPGGINAPGPGVCVEPDTVSYPVRICFLALILPDWPDFRFNHYRYLYKYIR